MRDSAPRRSHAQGPSCLSPNAQSWIFALAFTGLLLVIDLVPQGWLARAFSLRGLRLMGVLGFSWYLLHFPVFQFTHFLRAQWGGGWPVGDLAWFVIAWALCALASSLGFRLVEQPGMALERRLESRRAG